MEWISVKDQPPTFEQDIIAWSKKEKGMMDGQAYQDDGGAWFVQSEDSDPFYFDKWIPYPKPPKE